MNAESESEEEYEKKLNEKALAEIKEACARIMEYCDSVQIVATRHVPELGTIKHCWGDGNLYARISSAEQWVDRIKIQELENLDEY